MDNRLQEHRLWYSKPAKEWNEALPVGNGRLGAMVFGEFRRSVYSSTRTPMVRRPTRPEQSGRATQFDRAAETDPGGASEGSGGAGLASPSRTSGNAAPLPSARRSSPDV